MSKRHRIAPDPSAKPTKPSPDFPLFAHNNGTWAKKIRGKLHYFGPWAGMPGPDHGADAALTKYLAEKDDLHAGRMPREAPGALTVFTLCGRFLTAKQHQRDAGELTERTFADYTATCQRLIKAFGRNRLVADLRPDDFERLRSSIAKQYGPARLAVEVTRARAVFGYAFKGRLLDRPVIYGDSFKVPSQRTLRLHRAEQGPRMFEADEIRRMLQAAGQPLRAMILLGINCGFGNADCGTLPMAALDLDGGWVNYHRPKTGITRRCPLWPETVAAVKEWLSLRPEPAGEAAARLAFLTRYGLTWQKKNTNPITQAMCKLLDTLGIDGRGSFYSLRHTFMTVADEAGDFWATRYIMGHASDDISTHYRERISDERLRKVTDHVRAWLFGAPGNVQPSLHPSN
jgi:integrase